MSDCNQKNSKAKNPEYICNPKTGRWVKKNGEIGKKILEQQEHKHDQNTSETPKQDPIITQIKKIPLTKKKIELKTKQSIKLSTKQPTVQLSKNSNLPEFKLDKIKSVYYFIPTIYSNPQKLAVFDLDGTIITTQSGQTFATSANDWIFTYSNVPETLANLVGQGYQLIIISNQAGISSGQTSLTMITEKLKNIYLSLNLPMQIYLSSEKDNYRKPMTDIWDFCLANNSFNELSLDGFYCGDAAGRPKGYIKGKPKDFNITDRYFAHNIGLPFLTPEELFLKMKPFTYVDVYEQSLNLSQYYPTSIYPIPKHLSESSKNLIIMVGPPASGKTTLSQSLFSDYTYLSNDIIKNAQKLKKMFVDSINGTQNVIIDNTNPEKDTRTYYINVAKTKGYNIFCYFFNIPKLMTMHLNQMRIQMTHGGKAIPDIAIHTYYKKLQKPELTEGFTEIIEINQLHFISSENKVSEQFKKYYYYKYDI